jgi:hypothetical protein
VSSTSKSSAQLFYITCGYYYYGKCFLFVPTTRLILVTTKKADGLKPVKIIQIAAGGYKDCKSAGLQPVMKLGFAGDLHGEIEQNW